MRANADELTDYVFAMKRKAWHRYSLEYWWWHIRRILDFIMNRPLCFLGKHKIYDGIFHAVVLPCGEKGSFKCYHCRFCGKPSNEEWCRGGGMMHEAFVEALKGNDGGD